MDTRQSSVSGIGLVEIVQDLGDIDGGGRGDAAGAPAVPRRRPARPPGLRPERLARDVEPKILPMMEPKMLMGILPVL